MKVKNFSLVFSIIINVFITAAEAIVGFIIGSLALISDAVHNFSDVGALGFSWWGEKIKKKEPNRQKTFGYKRAEIIIALFNSLFLLAVVIFIFYEAIGRIFDPAEIQSNTMIIMALVALVGNGIATYLLEKDAHKNLNMKSAWLHSFQDALFSLGVVLGAIVIHFTNWFILDPIISILLSLYILKEAYNLIKQTVNILMESIPDDVDYDQVKNSLVGFKEVESVEDLHIWQTDESSRFLSAHLIVGQINATKRHDLLCRIKETLDKNFRIGHMTIQMVSDDEKLNLNCNHCN